MARSESLIDRFLQFQKLPFYARPALRLAVRLGLIRSGHVEAVLRYLDTADEAVSWWPPIGLILLCALLLLSSVGLLIASLVEFIFRLHPLWLAWTELGLSICCFWSPLFILAAHYAAKIRMLYSFAREESENISRVAKSTATHLRRGHDSIRAATDAQFERMQQSGNEQLDRLQAAGTERLSKLREQGSGHIGRIRDRFRPASSDEEEQA